MAEKEVVRFGPFKNVIADGVRVGNTIQLSGAVSVDAEGNVLHVGDMSGQVRQAYRNIAEVLEKFGATMDDIAYETMFVTDMDAVVGSEESMNAVFGARAEAYGGTPEVAQSLIGVAALAIPELMVEIKVVAYV